MSDELAGLKALQRAIWSAGDYDAIAELFWDVGEVVAGAAAIEPGMKVLDVATGTGNAAIRAAEAGAEVVGLDLTPELFADARRHEALAGVSVEWIEGDAEALPFDDDDFDRVLSTFGVMFAPSHEVAAAELVRVCRPGGRIVLANWTPDGFIGHQFALFADRMPAPPPPTPPTLWGDEGHVRSLLGGQILLAIERRSVDLVSPSIEEAIADYERRFGPMVLAKQALDAGAYDGLKADLTALVESFDVGDREVRIAAEYLLLVGLKP
jgi:ubiquinone/menaquinone biosynthesis C-methylase UbiE